MVEPYGLDSGLPIPSPDEFIESKGMNMIRRSRFIPNFDHLGLRITPSDIAPTVAGPGIVEESTPSDDLGIPGGDTLISDSITFILPGLEEQQAVLANEAMMTNVDWILPTG